MRVGILSQYYPPEMGAPQARLSQLAARLTERGHEVFVLTALPNYPQGRIFSGYRRAVVRERHGEVPGNPNLDLADEERSTAAADGELPLLRPRALCSWAPCAFHGWTC